MKQWQKSVKKQVYNKSCTISWVHSAVWKKIYIDKLLSYFAFFFKRNPNVRAKALKQAIDLSTHLCISKTPSDVPWFVFQLLIKLPTITQKLAKPPNRLHSLTPFQLFKFLWGFSINLPSICAESFTQLPIYQIPNTFPGFTYGIFPSYVVWYFISLTFVAMCNWCYVMLRVFMAKKDVAFFSLSSPLEDSKLFWP